MSGGLTPDNKHKLLGVLGLILLVLAACFVIFVGSQVFLLFFAALLLALFLRKLAKQLHGWIGLPPRWGVLIVILVLTLGAGLLLTVFSVNVVQQIGILSDLVQQAVEDLYSRLEEEGWIDVSGQDLPDLSGLLSSGTAAIADITRAVSATLNVVLSLLIVFVVGVFLAIDADRYRRGAMALIPPQQQARAAEILDRVLGDLWLWLAGRLISMALIGVLTTGILVVLAIPMPVTLGLIAALLSFVPNIGAVVAILLPALLAIQQGIGTVIAVVAAYTAVQMLESYGITPLVQQHIAKLPAVLVIFSQILAGILFGLLGLALAAPLMLVAIVLIEELYLRPRDRNRKSSDEAGRGCCGDSPGRTR